MQNILQKILVAIFCHVFVSIIAEPQAPTKGYLPPTEGYNYNPPSVPFPSPSPSPSSYYTVPSYRPQPTQRPRPSTIYSTPSPLYSSPAYIPPSYNTPKPYPPPQPTYGLPSYEGGEISGSQIGAGSGGGEFDHLRQPHVSSMPFDFSYAVKDDYYGTDFAHSANSNGDQVKGEYRVQLPDGRLQIVKYLADWKDGYTAEVTYQGEAKYPDGVPGASGSSYGGGGVGGGGYSYPNPGSKTPLNPTYSNSKPNSGFAGNGYSAPAYASGGIQQSYTASPSISGQQPISGYGGSQQASGSYSNPSQSYSASDYGSF